MIGKLLKALEPGEAYALRLTRRTVLRFQCWMLGLLLIGGVYVHYPRYDWREVQPVERLGYHEQQMKNACMVNGRFLVERFKTFILNYPNRSRRFEWKGGPSNRNEVPLALALLHCVPEDAMTRVEREELDRWLRFNTKELGLS